MADESYNPRVYREQGGKRFVVASTGSLDIESGGEMDVEAGGAFKIAGTAISASAAELNRADGVTPGTVTGGKNAVPDTNKDLASLRRLTVDQYVAGAVESVASTSPAATKKKPAWTALSAYGLSDLSCTGSTGKASFVGFSLPHPGVAGVRKDIVLANGSTAKPAYVEMASTGQYIGGATGSTGKTYHRMAFNDVGEAISLESASTVAWRLLNNHNTVTLTTDFTT